jgi:hypothetical protein
MDGIAIALAIISMVTIAGMSGMFSSSNPEPTANSYYKGGKTIKRQRNKNNRTKSLRAMK